MNASELLDLFSEEVAKICLKKSGKSRHLCRCNKSEMSRRYQKKHLRRARRRAEKQDPENAGTKNRHFTWGWSD